MVVKKIVFLDRDGVLTIPTNIDGKGFAPKSMKEVNFYSDVKSALDILDRHSFKLIVVSNQPDISTGKVNEEFVKKTNDLICEKYPILDIFVCPHNRNQKCRCRKPQVGLFEAARIKWDLDLSSAWMIGDRDSDIEAGNTLGCKTIFINRGWIDESGSQASFNSNSLMQAAEIVVNYDQKSRN